MNLDAISSAIPYGGVISPNAKVTMITTPMCAGLMAELLVSSVIIGMKMMMAGIASHRDRRAVLPAVDQLLDRSC